ncbi:MAG: hypothetical protein QOG71_3524 [Pyrinomonadaceae bacterium]|nr:hypothetical protein [Pyrinomonadaceae bacterium]
MSTNESRAQGTNASAPVAKDAPTEQQASQAGAPKRFERGQTVCNEKNDKGKLCNGHLKQVSPVGEEARQHMRGDDLLYRCQTCGARYMGPPLGHVRDPRKQARYVQSELVAILEAAGGTLPAFKQNEAGAWIPAGETTSHAHAPVAAAAQNIKPVAPVKPTPPVAPAATGDAPSDETPEEKRARIIAEANAKAAARMAGGGATAPGTTPAATSPTAASPAPAASGDAPDGETADERRARMMAEVKAKTAARMAAKGGAANASDAPEAAAASKTTNAPAATKTTDAPAASKTPTAPPAAVAAAPSVAPEGETADEKRARQMAEIKAKAAARMAAKNNSAGGAKTGGETSIATPPTTAQPPSPTSGTDSSAAADAHRPAAEAQAATGQASAAPLSPAAATASPAAGAETVADLAPDASTELTPGAPRDERAADEGATE